MNAETRQQQWAVAIADAESQFNEIAIPDGNLVTYQREASFAMQAVTGSEYLQKCSPESLRHAVINVASVGLSLSPALKLAYLVPRKGKACLDISYIGLVKIATDSGSVAAAHATIVRANDDFEYFDAFTSPRHKFDPFAPTEHRGDVLGVYCVAKLANGISQIETLSMQEIAKIREMSKAKDGPWFDWFEEMVKKSVVKRGSKMWPRTERLSQAVAILNDHQGNEIALTPDAEPVAVPQPTAKEPAAPTSKTTPGPAAATDGNPISEGQLRIVRAKLKNAALTDADLCARFTVDKAESLRFAQFAEIQEWIIDRAKTVA